MNAVTRIVASPERARLRVEDFVLLSNSGAFADYAKTELIEGEIYYMNAQWSRHARVKSRLLVALSLRLRALSSDLEALSEVSIELSQDTMPEPDIVLTTYRGSGPVPVETIGLIVEISDTTLENDLGRKARLYAAAGVPEYWVIDLNENRALLHERGDADRYHACSKIMLGEQLTAVTLTDLEVDTIDLLD